MPPTGSTFTAPALVGEFRVTEEAVRGLSIPRLRLLILMLQGHVPPKPGNVSYAERAVRILKAGKEPFFAAQWELVQTLPQTARHDPVLCRQLKESADKAVSAVATPPRAQFVPAPAPAESETGPGAAEDDDDWHSVEGPPSDLQGRAAPPPVGIPLADNEYSRLTV